VLKTSAEWNPVSRLCLACHDIQGHHPLLSIRLPAHRACSLCKKACVVDSSHHRDVAVPAKMAVGVIVLALIVILLHGLHICLIV
jgi:hypothetical protein